VNTLPLPEPIAAYFAAEHEPAALAQCFTAHAVMKDDGHTYTGVEAITTFLAKAWAKYRATSLPFAIEREDSVQLVRANVTGNFPGSPIVMSYRFRLERGLIASLEITT
jgi:hypothetical protein